MGQNLAVIVSVDDDSAAAMRAEHVDEHDIDRQPRSPIDALAVEIQLRYGRSRLTRTNIVRAEDLAVVMFLLVDALVVLYDLTQLRHLF